VTLYLLDTNAWIAYLKGHPRVVERAWREPRLAISAVSLGELSYGARKSAKVEANLRRVERLASLVRVLPIDERVAEAYGWLRLDLERAGRPLGANDLWIAATAKAHDLVLVSADQAFRQVPGLRLEDWTV